MSEISTHVLDTSAGKPAAGVPVVLEAEVKGGWKELARGETDADGRLRFASSPGSGSGGIYRLTFETRAYFQARKIEALYPQVCVVFQVRNANERHHIPLLLSPYGYSTCRGS
ncbi:MAG TPA: hydroxyisourate hydrolase [Candidatus Limnocylindrales bacterium]|nr:hydroxyisourate hydrolase [Candidatus Limnocylindrales bacterium]